MFHLKEEGGLAKECALVVKREKSKREKKKCKLGEIMILTFLLDVVFRKSFVKN
jgi:uncharacterized protein YggL (DUF469 family)